MKRFQVYKHNELGYESVKIGWCWPAFLFSWIWALIAKLWLPAIIGLIISIIDIAISGGSLVYTSVTYSSITSIIYISIAIVFGINGNEWRANSLVKRGYKLIDSVNALSKDDAIGIVGDKK